MEACSVNAGCWGSRQHAFVLEPIPEGFRLFCLVCSCASLCNARWH